MKIVVYGPERRVGALLDDIVVDLAADLGAFIEAGPRAIDSAEKQVAGRRGLVHETRSVRLHAPHVRGARIACAGGNFADHTAAMAERRSDVPNFSADLVAIAAEMRARGIWGFWKVVRDAAGPGDDIRYPARTKLLDYEGELAVVVGRGGRDIRAEAVLQHVWGVTLFADWSLRDGIEPPAPQQFSMRKNFDTCFSMGPCIVVGEGIDPANVQIQTYVNGELRQNFNTRDMVVSFGEYLAYLSRDLTFHPGDALSGGTAAGTAADSSAISKDGVYAPERFLKPGDVVEVRSPVIGVLGSRIVAASPA
jgi:2-keto-4-pentenoate hydratase/2-oxohepta-3-ene-1,7-dioic acid hydratase in catechol pathway